MDITKGSYGYAGQILKINLTDGSIEKIPTSKYSDKYIGGRAMGAAIYWETVPPECDVFDPENAIIWTCGVGCGVLGPGPSRVAICTKAPATNPEAYSVSTTGAGHWGAELRFAGYDGLIVTGKAETPVYIHITDDVVEILPADILWGKGCRDTDNELKRLWGVQTRIAQIGPGGEMLNRYSAIMTDFSHATGQGGFGAVMGSKNLKAIAVHGTGGIKVARPKELIELFYNKVILEGPNTNSSINEAASSPYKTFNLWPVDPEVTKTFPHAESIEELWNPDSAMGNAILMKDDITAGKATWKFGGCWSCPMGCHFSARYTDINIPTTPMNLCHQSHQFKAQNFATSGRLWGASDYLFSALCIDYGMSVDLFGVGNEWLNALMEAGCITEEDFQLDYEWDLHDPNIWLNEKFLRDVVHKVVYKEGSEKLNHIADGPDKCLKWFADNDPRAVNIYYKYCQIERYNSTDGDYKDPNKVAVDPISTLCRYTDYKFMHHHPADKLKGGGKHFDWLPADEKKAVLKAGQIALSNRLFGTDNAFGYLSPNQENSYTGKAEPAIFLQHAELEEDSMTLCGWAGWPIFASTWTADHVGAGGLGTEMYNCIMGTDYYMEDQNKRYSAAWTLMRCIHVREGRRREDDLRFLNNPVHAFAVASYGGGAPEAAEAFTEYYEARGWDPETGIPRRSTLKELGLGNVADELENKYGIALKD